MSAFFEHWKARFRKDCEEHDKVNAFNSLGESVLRLLGESGTEPNVQAIIDTGEISNPLYIGSTV